MSLTTTQLQWDPLIRTPKMQAPPSNGQLLNLTVDQIRVGQWAWQVDNA